VKTNKDNGEEVCQLVHQYIICSATLTQETGGQFTLHRFHNIHFAALYLTNNSFDEILKPLINDLVTLAETDISVTQSEGTFTLRGGLCTCNWWISGIIHSCSSLKMLCYQRRQNAVRICV